MSTTNHPLEQEQLMAYLDGELQADRAADAAAHLELCPDCQRLVADLQEVSERLMAWKVEESEREVPRPIAETLDAAKKKLSPWGGKPWVRLPFSLPRRVLWAGGVALAALMIFAMLRPNFDRSRRQAETASSLPDYQEREAKRQRVPAVPQHALQSQEQKLRASPSATPGTESTSDDISLNGRLSGSPNGNLGKLERDEDQGGEDQTETSNVPAANGPMIIRTAELELTTTEFDKARSAVDEILKRNHGHVAQLNVGTPPGSGRALSGSLRVPANRLDSVLSDLRSLGRVQKESQGGEEVTERWVDLEARLANAKHTEQRMIDIQHERTGKLSDVLAVEVEIGRVRGEIEQMEAQRKSMKNQVDFATLTLTVSEAYKAELKAVPPSTGTEFHNAAVEGYRTLVDGIIAVVLWLLSSGPSLLVWTAILFFPARMLWKRLRPRFTQKTSEV